MTIFRKTQIFFALVLLCVYANATLGHPGATDFQGGHINSKTHEYHCHKEPCFSNQQQVKNAHQKAEESKSAVSQLYNREDWPHWIDADNDCQDTRAEILLASSLVQGKFKFISECTVTWGIWLDPYTGKTIFDASAIDIDHVVPLAHAHRNGGADWSTEKKSQFANDPLNLVAVDSGANRSKSDHSPNEWMPPRKEYWCEYIKRWRVVKVKYGLTASNDESVFIDKINRNCER